MRFRVAGIKIRFTHFETHTRERTLPAYTDSGGGPEAEREGPAGEFESRGEAVRLVGVRVSGLERDSADLETLDQLRGWLGGTDEGGQEALRRRRREVFSRHNPSSIPRPTYRMSRLAPLPQVMVCLALCLQKPAQLLDRRPS